MEVLMSLKTLVLMTGLLPQTYIAEMPLQCIRKADRFFFPRTALGKK
jgi:hypothetical protein